MVLQGLEVHLESPLPQLNPHTEKCQIWRNFGDPTMLVTFSAHGTVVLPVQTAVGHVQEVHDKPCLCRTTKLQSVILELSPVQDLSTFRGSLLHQVSKTLFGFHFGDNHDEDNVFLNVALRSLSWLSISTNARRAASRLAKCCRKATPIRCITCRKILCSIGLVTTVASWKPTTLT